jgi:hypothetical protein
MHSTNDLKDGYLGSGTHIRRSIKKYGSENHKFEVLEMLGSRAELRIREQEILTEEFISDPLCMNIRFSCSAGNDPGFWQKKDRSKASKKISEAAKAMWARRKADPAAYKEHIEKINKPENVEKRAAAIKAKGHKRSPEQLAKLSAGQAKYYSEVSKEELLKRGRKGAEARAKTWIIEDVSGAQQEVKDLVKFSLAHGLSRTALYKTEKAGTFRSGYRIVGRK